MSNDDLKSHVDDIINALGEKPEKEVSREELENELCKFMEYGVPIDQAKQTLVKKYGGVAVLSSTQLSQRTLISDLLPNERRVNILCRVISVNPKEITVKGDNRKIFFGILGDESGTASFTSWNSEIDFEKGDVIQISNAYTREWQGTVQINLGDRVRIQKTDKEKLPDAAFEPKVVKIKDLRSGLGAVDLTARVVNIEAREIDREGQKKKVFSGIFADETGKAQFTSWHDFKLKEGDVIRVTGGYIKSWKGIPQLTFDEKAIVKKLEKGKIPKGDLKTQKMPLFTLIEKRGALDVEIEGTIIDIRPGSGIIIRCSDCSRTLQNGECAVHGKVEGKEDLRLKLVVDDGTGSVGSIINKEITEELIGKSFEELKKMDENSLQEFLLKKLFAQKIILQGNALGDNFGTSIIVKNAKFVDIDISEEAEKLNKDLEELL